MKTNSPFSWRALCVLGCVAAGVLAAHAGGEVPYDHYLPSNPNTVTPGIYSAEYAPALRIKSGERVKIDTINFSGVNRTNPKKFFLDNGIPLDLPVVQDILEIAANMPVHATTGRVGASLTGPVYIEEAESGDMLEVRVLDIKFRAPYGVNSTNPGSGHPLADLVPRPWTQKFDLDLERNVAIFRKGEIELPLAPFNGQMGVAPPPSAGAFVSSPPTAKHGGNFDLQELVKGGTLYLPVNVKGALYFTGNGHALQGNGEITNPSLEVSLTTYLQFIVHKGKTLKMPRVETPTHYVFFGMHDSLDEGMRQATLETVEFLQEAEKLDFYDAYALTSTAVDFTVARALLPTQMVYSFVPKNVFKQTTDYWYKDVVPVKY
jgi:acetamidase/formamidase